MYNRYQGNSGRVERVNDRPGPAQKPQLEGQTPNRTPPFGRPVPPPPGQKRPPSPLSGLSGELGKLLSKLSPMGLETEDLLLIMILYLLYRESDDTDFLFMIGGLLFL